MPEVPETADEPSAQVALRLARRLVLRAAVRLKLAERHGTLEELARARRAFQEAQACFRLALAAWQTEEAWGHDRPDEAAPAGLAGLSRSRLLFARWLVQQGRLTEWPAPVRQPATAR
jgi:hypothetical protein